METSDSGLRLTYHSQHAVEMKRQMGQPDENYQMEPTDPFNRHQVLDQTRYDSMEGYVPTTLVNSTSTPTQVVQTEQSYCSDEHSGSLHQAYIPYKQFTASSNISTLFNVAAPAVPAIPENQVHIQAENEPVLEDSGDNEEEVEVQKPERTDKKKDSNAISQQKTQWRNKERRIRMESLKPEIEKLSRWAKDLDEMFARLEIQGAIVQRSVGDNAVMDVDEMIGKVKAINGKLAEWGVIMKRDLLYNWPGPKPVQRKKK